MIAQQESLTVVLCVHNAARAVTARVDYLLDLLADLQTSFEVVLLDNGSTDGTEEVLYELSQSYPQIRVVRHSERQDDESMFRTGFREASGDLVMVYKENSAINTDELSQLWKERSTFAQSPKPRLMPMATPTTPADLMTRLSQWATALPLGEVEFTASSPLVGHRKQIQRLELDEPVAPPVSPMVPPAPRMLPSRQYV